MQYVFLRVIFYMICTVLLYITLNKIFMYLKNMKLFSLYYDSIVFKFFKLLFSGINYDMYKWMKAVRKIILFVGVLIVSFVVSDFISLIIWSATLYFTDYTGYIGTFSDPIWLGLSIVVVIICDKVHIIV